MAERTILGHDAYRRLELSPDALAVLAEHLRHDLVKAFGHGRFRTPPDTTDRDVVEDQIRVRQRFDPDRQRWVIWAETILMDEPS